MAAIYHRQRHDWDAEIQAEGTLIEMFGQMVAEPNGRFIALDEGETVEDLADAAAKWMRGNPRWVQLNCAGKPRTIEQIAERMARAAIRE